LNGSTEAEAQAEMRKRVTRAMQEKFKPEFLNRIDESVIFNSLSKKDLRGIVVLEAKRLENRLTDRQITLTLTDAALDFLADVGFDPVYGARPLKRTIQRELETKVATGILNGDFSDGDNITCDVINERLTIVKTGIGEFAAADPGTYTPPPTPASPTPPFEATPSGSFDL